MSDRTAIKSIRNRFLSSEPKVTKLSRRCGSEKIRYRHSTTNQFNSFKISEKLVGKSKDKRNLRSRKKFSVSKVSFVKSCSFSQVNYNEKKSSVFSKNANKQRNMGEREDEDDDEETTSAAFERIPRSNKEGIHNAIVNHHNPKIFRRFIDQTQLREIHVRQRDAKQKRKRRMAGYFRCSRLCLFCGLVATILIAGAIAAIILALLNQSKTTKASTTTEPTTITNATATITTTTGTNTIAIITTIATSMTTTPQTTTVTNTMTVTTTKTTTTDTTSVTTTTTDTSSTTDSSTTTETTSATTTTTTETTTMTYAPTGIYALNISTCATWDPNGITVAGNENGTNGTDSRSLNAPTTIFIDNNYTLYICDRDNHRIMKYFVNATTGIVAAGITGSLGSNATQLNQPKGVAVDQMGAIIVADSNNYRIQRFPLGSTDGITIGINSSTTPLGITRDLHIDVNNVVYVTDSDNSRIVKFLPGNQIGIIVAGAAGVGSAANQFQAPYGTFVNESQILYVADSNNQRIQRWLAGATSGTTVAGINGSPGPNLTQLSNPQAVVLDNNEYMYIVDRKNNRIVRWTDNYAAGGTCIVGCTGTAGNGPTQLNGPRDLKFDASGNLYVSDQGNNRVQKYLIQYTNCSSSGR